MRESSVKQDSLDTQGACGAQTPAGAQVPSNAQAPSMDAWLAEAKAHETAPLCGMYLTHNGVVRELPKKLVRQGIDDGSTVVAMNFSYDADGLEQARQRALQMPGIHYVRCWLNEGTLQVGDDIMFVLIGGDIRPHVVDCLQWLVGTIKNELVSEVEVYG